MDLTKITPHQVSRDLSGYITYIYGPPKAGKTTLGSEFPKPLILAAEHGYNALPGVMAQDVMNWSDIRQVIRELKRPEVQELFNTIVVDTVDVAAGYCEKYICSQNNIDSIGDLGYGKGWTALKKEFEDVFRTIIQLGYAVLFISHSKEETRKKQDGTEYSVIRPSVANTYNQIVENMADIYGYMHPVTIDGKTEVRITLRSFDGTISAGGRFKHIVPEIKSSYKDLVKALNDAIDAEVKDSSGKYVTDEKITYPVKKELDYDALTKEFQDIISDLSKRDDFNEFWHPRITQIIEKYLGKGKKISNATRDQVEQIQLIIIELKDLNK